MRSARKNLERLLGKKRGKGRLPTAAERDAIAAAISTAYPSGADLGSGNCFGTLTDSSGFFILYSDAS